MPGDFVSRLETGNGTGALGPGPAPSLSGGSPVEGVTGMMEALVQSVKPVGLFRTEDHRYYWNGTGPLPSVTNVLKVIHKEAIVEWNSRETARALLWALDNGWLDLWKGEDIEGLIGWAKAQPKHQMDDAAALGSDVHLLADMASRETAATVLPVPDEALPYVEAFRGFLGWLSASEGQILSSEHAIFNLLDGYAGTYDLILEMGDAVWMVDIKTGGGGTYPEFGLQLAGYAHGQFIGLEGDPTQYAMPHIDRYAILHIRPSLYTDTGWRLIEYPVTARDYVAFLAALDLYQWKGEGRFTKSILNKATIKGER